MQKFERRARRPLKRTYEPPWFSLAAAKKIRLSQSEETAASINGTSFDQSATHMSDLSGHHFMPHGRSDIAIKREPGLQDDVKPMITAENVLDFLKNRPQLADLKKSSEVAFPSGAVLRNLAGEEVDDLVKDDSDEGCPASWQHNETVVDFLRRLPVDDPATARVGPWLWVSNPQPKRHWQEQRSKFALYDFTSAAEALLESFVDQRTKLEKDNPGKTAATITRKMGPYKETLESDILLTARKHHVTSGKWMFFPNNEDLPRTWRMIAEATAAGRLGPTSKAGTWEPGNDKKGTLICVYTYNFFDVEDVKRVLLELVELGLTSRDAARQVYYKCDAYTYLNLGSENPYKIRASLFGSKEMLDGEVKITEDGKILRVKKTNKTMFDFLQK